MSATAQNTDLARAVEPVNATNRAPHTCTTCAWYRPARPPSQILTSSVTVKAFNKEAHSMFAKIGEEDARRRKLEAQEKMQQADAFSDCWRHRPVVTSYCGFQEDQQLYLIHQVKNRGGRCLDYAEGPFPPHRCTDCAHRVIPADPSHGSGSESFGPMQATELQAVYFGNGFHPTEPQMLSYCAKYSQNGAFYICALQNVYDSCAGWEPGLAQLAANAIQINTDSFFGIDSRDVSTTFRLLNERLATWFAMPGDEQALAVLLGQVCECVVIAVRRLGPAKRIELAENLVQLRNKGPHAIAGADTMLQILEFWLRDNPATAEQEAPLRDRLPPTLVEVVVRLQQVIEGPGAYVKLRRQLRAAIFAWGTGSYDVQGLAALLMLACSTAATLLVAANAGGWTTHEARAALAGELEFCFSFGPLPIGGADIFLRYLQAWLDPSTVGSDQNRTQQLRAALPPLLNLALGAFEQEMNRLAAAFPMGSNSLPPDDQFLISEQSTRLMLQCFLAANMTLDRQAELVVPLWVLYYCTQAAIVLHDPQPQIEAWQLANQIGQEEQQYRLWAQQGPGAQVYLEAAAVLQVLAALLQGQAPAGIPGAFFNSGSGLSRYFQQLLEHTVQGTITPERSQRIWDVFWKNVSA